MPRFIVTEVVRYGIIADTEEQACEMIADNSERDALVIEVAERDAEEAAPDDPRWPDALRSEYDCIKCKSHVTHVHHDKYPLCLKCWNEGAPRTSAESQSYIDGFDDDDANGVNYERHACTVGDE
jgi:hypothetical protein